MGSHAGARALLLLSTTTRRISRFVSYQQSAVGSQFFFRSEEFFRGAIMSRFGLFAKFIAPLGAALVLAVAAIPGVGSAHQSYRFVVVTHGQASDPFWSV